MGDEKKIHCSAAGVYAWNVSPCGAFREKYGGKCIREKEKMNHRMPGPGMPTDGEPPELPEGEEPSESDTVAITLDVDENAAAFFSSAFLTSHMPLSKLNNCRERETDSKEYVSKNRNIPFLRSKTEDMKKISRRE